MLVALIALLIVIIIIAAVLLVLYFLRQKRESVNPDAEDEKILKANTKGDKVTMLSDTKSIEKIQKESVETNQDGDHPETLGTQGTERKLYSERPYSEWEKLAFAEPTPKHSELRGAISS